LFVDRAKNDLKKEIGDGTQVTKFFFGGHSLGGSSVASYVDGIKGKDAEGTFAWGAYVSHKIEDPAKNYPSPFLTVGAELDGWLARITRIAKSYDQMTSSSIEDPSSRYPVVVIPGIDHADFLYGDPPKKVKTTDLRSEISPDAAVEQIANVTANFITMTRMAG
jgi:hypothetical protein